MSTEVKILHASCCASQSPIKEHIRKVARENNLEIRITELSDIQDTMAYGTLSFPSLVINGKVYAYKEIRTDEALLSIL